MDNFFDKALHYLGKKNGDQNLALNIGSMDGVMFDEMIGYTNTYNFKVLYVEPIPYLFEKLKSNIPSPTAMFENSAISDYMGEIEMITIDETAIDKGLVHSCFYGMSAVYPPKNGLGSEGDRLTVEKYGKRVTVPCITFDTLIEKHNIKNIDIIKVDAEGHDGKIFKQFNLSLRQPKVIRLEWINLSEEEQNEIIDILVMNNYKYEILGQDITALREDLYNELLSNYTKPLPAVANQASKVTVVTGIWNIKRDSLTGNWSRSFDHYLNNFEKLLKSPDNFIIFIEKEYEQWVWDRRDKSNTLVILKELEWFKSNDFIFNKIQEIRNNPDWYNQVGWLSDSTQAKLEMYNPIVMSKMFLLNDAAIFDPFDSTHLVWVDGALTNTVHEGYFWHDKVIGKLDKYFNKFSFVAFPYDGKAEIHGFTYSPMCVYANDTIDKVCRGGIFGGPKHIISKTNEIYYNLLVDTLSAGYMGTEESIFTIMLYKHPELFQYFSIEMNGLLGTFFENLKNSILETKIQSNNIAVNLHNIDNVALYVLTYNSPDQFEKLCISFEEYDRNFLTKPKKFLLNNSLNRDTDVAYSQLCDKYGFEEIKKDNLGICGGRQFIAEHAEANAFDYHFFFEDDMFFYLGKDEFCRNGFRRKIKDFYNILMGLTWNENFDFVKWNFTEFYGDNTKQWAWHNVPTSLRSELFPAKPVKLTSNTEEAPYVKYNNIKSYSSLAYATGEIYYCNWPQVVSREGNKKMFLTTKWAHPFEQTWMSYIYQETLKGNIYPGVLLSTPTEHNRFEFYSAEERREN
jgi:FkbM family methyltransferase